MDAGVRRNDIAVVILLLGSLFCATASAREHKTGFIDRSITVGGQTHRYQVFLPAEWDPRQKWPVILFLHGAGERGQDGRLQTKAGIGPALRAHTGRFPFIVVMPQCPKGRVWVEPEMELLALAALDHDIREFNGDPHRVYLTGLSMGGYGTWDIAARYPHRFAAYAVVCGGLRAPNGYPEIVVSLARNEANILDPYTETARRIGRVPVWIFHGERDDTVPVEESRKMYAALQAAGASVRYTEYPATGHMIEKAYLEPGLTDWLLQQHLPKK